MSVQSWLSKSFSLLYSHALTLMHAILDVDF